MKRRLLALIPAAILVWSLTACSDHGGNDVTPNPSISGSSVTKAEIAAVLWGVTTTTDASGTAAVAAPSADAKCVAGSHFKIGKDGAFDLMRSPSPDDPFSRRVVVVSAVNIAFDDPTTDGRGADCAAQGTLQYAVAASKDDGIEIEVAPDLAAKQNLYSMAGSQSAAYPKCTITAYFDKAEPSKKCSTETAPTTCGAEGQTCCGAKPDQTCNDGLSCSTDSICETASAPVPICGADGQACCGTAPSQTCNSGLSCLVNVCGPPSSACGASGHVCCGTAPNQTCNNGLTCAGGTCGPKLFVPRHPIDPGILPHFAAQTIDPSAAADATQATGPAADCTEDQIHPIRLVVDDVDCRVVLKPGQLTPWDTRGNTSPNHPTTGSYSRPNSSPNSGSSSGSQ